jgi:hypothetical protein
MDRDGKLVAVKPTSYQKADANIYQWVAKKADRYGKRKKNWICLVCEST